MSALQYCSFIACPTLADGEKITPKKSKDFTRPLPVYRGAKIDREGGAPEPDVAASSSDSFAYGKQHRPVRCSSFLWRNLTGSKSFSDGNNYQLLRYQLNLKHPWRYRPGVFRERPEYGTKVAASTPSLDVFGNSFKISYSPHR